MNKKPIVNAILIVLSLLMVGTMALQFAPGGTQTITQMVQGEQGTPAIKVNGQTITAEELREIQTNNPSPFAGQGPALDDDFRTLLISQVIRQELMTQAASDIDVTRADVDAEVTEVRESQGLTDDAAWTDALQRVGLSDSEYRKQVRDGLAIQRKTEQIEAETPEATAEEMQMYYDLNPTLFQTQGRFKGRQLVVDDEEKAAALLAQAREGANFEELARENSLVGAENGGALGALDERGALQAVESLVLPDEVAGAVDSLPAPGLTEVIPSGGQFYIVQVEELLPAETKPYAEVQAEVKEALEESKKRGAVERFMDEQMAGAKIEVVDQEWAYTDPTVAEVGGRSVPYSEVVGRVMQNQQLMMMMQSMDPAQVGEMINTMLKPSVVQQLIQEYAAPSIVEKEGIPVVGTRQDLVSGLIAYGGRDVEVTDEELRAAYDERQDQFATPASAVVSEATFPTREEALAFRQDWQGGDFTPAATKAGAIVSERGQIGPDTDVLEPSVLQAIFEGDLRDVDDVSLSNIVEASDGWKVVAVTELQPGEVLPFEEVRAGLESSLFNEKQASKGEEFVTAQVAALKPVDHLADVLAAQRERVGADEAAPAEGAPPADGAAAPTTDEGASEGEAAPAEAVPAEGTEGAAESAEPATATE
ncbi:peptidylprolyl isomerase [Deinococcus radiophilus]|uniref:peptidylprolyl isomerase n=1 Tax=Deinococcus radiophilus TaxID=32062 RepID=A0A3S0K9G9_9DEIO|nr:peptidylprolyl isomerase [Deinococcus radiophilus]RTR25644.1 peptidyl-prolyl cis-trans isomerase [Deinococcus radiophilus]UFA50887.1 peptidyl-prolyl cis-trans isomerase [Deinococcus radiophilus]